MVGKKRNENSEVETEPEATNASNQHSQHTSNISLNYNDLNDVPKKKLKI